VTGGGVGGTTRGDETTGAGGVVVVVVDGGGAGAVVVVVDGAGFRCQASRARAPDDGSGRVGRFDDELHVGVSERFGPAVDPTDIGATTSVARTGIAMSAARCFRIWHLPLGLCPVNVGLITGDFL
jgi:hypothetical protein